MKKIVFLVILMLLILACSSNKMFYQDKLKRYIGKNEQFLIQNFGKPTNRTILENGHEVWIYTKINDFYMPMEYYEGWLGFEPAGLTYFDNFNLSPYDEVVDTEIQDICQTKFIIQHGIITSFEFQGNDCK